MSSPDIQFATIPDGIRTPGVYSEFNTALANQSLPGNTQTTLIIGQSTAQGSVPPLTLTGVFSDAQAAAYFGFGSQIHRMVMAALTANPQCSLSAIAVSDVAGSLAAVWTVTFTGVPTASGSLTLGLNADVIQVNPTPTDTPATIAAEFAEQIAALPELPFKATNSGGVLTLTALNAGTVANAFQVVAGGAVPGVAMTVMATTPGASDPNITNALTAVFLGGFDQIVMPYVDVTNLTALKNFLVDVGGYAEKRWAFGFVASNGTLAAAQTLSSNINYGWMNNPWCRGSASTTMEIAAAYAATIAATTDPALPFDYVPVMGIAVPPVAQQMSRTEEESALNNGVTPLNVGPGQQVQIVRAITTYTLNAAGVPDVSFLDITTPRTMKYVAKAFIQNRADNYSRAKITGRLINDVRNTGIVLLKQLESLEIIQNVSANLPMYIVEQDLQDVNRINERIPTAVVPGLHILAERFDLMLQLANTGTGS
jgi:phage tail sheath gpL-like